MTDIVERLKEACVIDRHYGKSVTLTLDYDDYMEAADLITALRAENEKLRKDLSMSVFSDSEYCKVLEGEQERLLKSRNRWAQKYNNLLNEKRAEDGYDVYAAAREEYRKKIAEQAAENEKLRATLRDIAAGQVTYLPFIQTVARAALGGKDE